MSKADWAARILQDEIVLKAIKELGTLTGV
jgi:hypothetical protein